MQELPPILDEQEADTADARIEAQHPSIVDVPIEQLRFADYNPRKIDQQEFENLQRSIDEYGFVEPTVVNRRNMTIVGGHMRVRAAKELGYVTIPVVFVDLPASKEKALNIALNKISGSWDDQMLAELLATIDDFDMPLTGFSDEEIEALTADPFDEEPTPKKESSSDPKYTTAELKGLALTHWPQQAEVIGNFLTWIDERGVR